MPKRSRRQQRSRTSKRGPTQTCNQLTDCTTKVVLAINPFTRKWRAYEATTREPWSIESVGAWVIVGKQAFKPADLVQDFMVRHEVDEARARELVSGYPWHRPHMHLSADIDADQEAERQQLKTKPAVYGKTIAMNMATGSSSTAVDNPVETPLEKEPTP